MKTDSFVNVSGSYPQIVGKNCTTDTSKDGTAYNKGFIDEIIGMMQAFCHQGNIQISNNTESYSSSDALNGIRNSCGVPGEIVYLPCYDPSEFVTRTGARLIYLQGQYISVSAYPLLTQYIYCGDALNPTAEYFYRANQVIQGVFTRDISGSYLALPNIRGRFIRCAGMGYALEPNVMHDESIKIHEHTLYSSNAPGRVGKARWNKGPTSDTDKVTVELISTTEPVNTVYAKDSQVANGNETAPSHFTCYAFMRY